MSDVSAELSGMVQDFQNLDKALSDLSTLLSSSTTKLQQIETQSKALVTAATNAVEHHEEDLHALGNAIATVATQFKTDIEQADTQITTEAQTLTAAAQKTFPAVETVKTNAGHLHDGATQHSQDIQQEMHQFDDLVKQLESALSERIQHATDTVTQGTHALGDIAQKWTAAGEQMTHNLTDALQQTSDHVDQHFIAPIDDAVKQFTDLTKQIEDEVLSNPMQTLSDKLKNEILEEAQKLLDELAKDVEKIINDAVHELTEAGGSNDAVTKELKQIFEELQPVWNALSDALRSVQSIWDTVKNI